MKKRYLILIILIIFISGCTGSISPLGSGPNGIQIKFIQPEDSSLSRGLDEGSSLPIEIELTNYAECQVNGELCIKDTLSDTYGGVNEQCKNIDFEEARINNKKLELDQQKFIFSSQPYSNLKFDQETNLQATVKYNCDILTGPRRLCTQSPFEKDETKCRNFETISGNNLGSKTAPITVVNIDKQLSLGASNEVRLKTIITLRKMSKGFVSAFDEEQDSLKGNPVIVEVDYANSLMRCSGRDYKEGVLLWKSKDTEKVINCEILLNSGDLQENPFNIHLKYDYEITENKLIKINHIEKEEGN